MTTGTRAIRTVRSEGEAARATRERDVGYQVNRLARALRKRLARRLEGPGFTGPQAAVLLALAAAEGPATMSWTAERLGMDRPTFSGVARRLERDGWIASGAHPTDGRSRVLWLTEQAKGALPTLKHASSRVSAEALGALDAAEQLLLLDLLRRVADTLEAEEDAGMDQT